MKLNKEEYVVAVWAAPASGPGWSNQPVIALVRDRATQVYREVYIQPEAQTSEMRLLYNISADISNKMVALAEKVLISECKKRRHA